MKLTSSFVQLFAFGPRRDLPALFVATGFFTFHAERVL